MFQRYFTRRIRMVSIPVTLECLSANPQETNMSKISLALIVALQVGFVSAAFAAPQKHSSYSGVNWQDQSQNDRVGPARGGEP